MSIHETLDQSKILFDEIAQQLSIKIHEHAIWMVSNLGCTCQSVLNLMNFTKTKKSSTYSSEINVPKKYKKSKECLRIFNTIGPLPMHQCWWRFNTDPEIEIRIAPSQSTKYFYAQMKKSLHPSKFWNYNIQSLQT
jgi:hypothetical protein